MKTSGADTSIIKTTCAYCGVGCGIDAEVDAEQRVVKVHGDKQHPSSFGRLCSKGAALGETLGLDGRLLHPEVEGETVSWDQALNTISHRLQNIIAEHGPEAVALYGSGQLMTEDYYVANKFMKGFVGSANIDTNSRLCMSSAVAGHKRAFGTDTVPSCYEDLDFADLVVIIGSNTAWCHPIVYQRVRDAKERNPNMKVVVIDPRRTATCDLADLHLPLASTTDVTLLNGLLVYLEENNALDPTFIREKTEGFEAALAAARSDAPDLSACARVCQLNISDLEQFYQWFAETPRTVTLYSQGVKQSSSGADKVNAILNCHLATGRIGKEGSGPLSLTGQPNAMGGREVGGLANQLAAHLEIGNAEDRARVKDFWQSPHMIDRPGLPAVELFDAVSEGRIKAVWIMATNPVVSLPNADHVRAALSQCDCVIVSDCVSQTDTLALANIKLPAQGWSEKDGMVTNSERRISHQRALLPAAGQARPDWWIIKEVAQRMGFGKAFDYQHPRDIFCEHAALSGVDNTSESRLRDFDISALAELTEPEYENFKPIQWPVNDDNPAGRKRLFEDGLFFTESRKAQFIKVQRRAPLYQPDRIYPCVLNTGRLRDQWHTMTRSALSPRLNQHRPEPFVEVHPEDALKYQLKDGYVAHIRSVWGQMYARVRVTELQRPGDVFVPMHWSEQYARKGRIGAVVNPVVDPLSGQPESKHTPVAVRPLEARWYGFALTRNELMNFESEFRVKVVTAACNRYEFASVKNDEGWPEHVISSFESQYPDCEWQHYRDNLAGVFRSAAFHNGELTHAVFIASLPEYPWLPRREWCASQFSADQVSPVDRLQFLSGLAPDGSEAGGPIICACHNVSSDCIEAVIKKDGLTTHDQVGKACRAGTNCGSCIPEIKTILADVAVEKSGNKVA